MTIKVLYVRDGIDSIFGIDDVEKVWSDGADLFVKMRLDGHMGLWSFKLGRVREIYAEGE